MNLGVCQTPLSMEFSRKEYWNGSPCPPPGDLPRIKPTSSESHALQMDSLPLSHWGGPQGQYLNSVILVKKFSPNTIVMKTSIYKFGRDITQPLPESAP